MLAETPKTGILAGCSMVTSSQLEIGLDLARSFLAHHPGGRFSLLTLEPLSGDPDLAPGIRRVHPEDLALAGLQEPGPALKPLLLSQVLRQDGIEAAIFFDPATVVLRELTEVRESLGSRSLVLLPRLTARDESGIEFERECLARGAFSPGFIAVAQCPEGMDFLRWWADRLRDGGGGLSGKSGDFDQKWLEYAPIFFPGTDILRDPSYGVNARNLGARHVWKSRGQFLAGRRPLAFVQAGDGALPDALRDLLSRVPDVDQEPRPGSDPPETASREDSGGTPRSNAAAGSPPREWPAALTIVARNYLSHARILARSYLEHHPGASFYLLIVDGLPEGESLDPRIRLISIADLGLRGFEEMSFQYGVTELCTALKPAALLWVLDRREPAVAFLDPDVLVFRPMVELRGVLSRPAVVLTPHLLHPVPPGGRTAAERDEFPSGLYNLGFVAVSKGGDTAAFLEWWEARLRDHCFSRTEEGLFVDQKWADLVPALFASAEVLRDDTYNVAHWNLAERRLNHRDGTYSVNGRPVAFFHFSAIDLDRRDVAPRYQAYARVEAGTPLARLVDEYSRLQEENGFARCRTREYGYARFENGVRVDLMMREIYRGLTAMQRARFGNPFRGEGPGSFFEWAVRPDPERARLSPYVLMLHRLRKDVAKAFPDPQGHDRQAFLQWAMTSGASEMDYDPHRMGVSLEGSG